MGRLVHWERLEKRIEPFYPKPDRGRRPYPLRTMLRMQLRAAVLQPERPGNGGPALRGGVGAAFRGPAADGRAAGRDDDSEVPAPAWRGTASGRSFRGRSTRTWSRWATVRAWHRRGREPRRGAPSSRKNRKRERDPEMHQTKKANQWRFGMKAHIGVDAETGLAHSLAKTPANEADVATAHTVLHGGEETVWGDAGYQGVGKRDQNRDAAVDWRTAMKPGKRRLLDKSGAAEAAEKRKASVRAKVEHPFLYLAGARMRLHFATRRCATGDWREHAADRAAARVLESAHPRPFTPGGERGTIAPVFRRNGGKRGERPRIRGFLARFRNKRKHCRAIHPPAVCRR